MYQKRRNFVFTLFSSLSFINKLNAAWDGHSKDKKYCVEYRCIFSGVDINHSTFEKDRLNWERPDGMVKVIQKYVKEKKIIKSNLDVRDNGFSWHYVFQNRSSFEKFNKEVFLSGYFDQQKILKGYDYKLLGEYV